MPGDIFSLASGRESAVAMKTEWGAALYVCGIMGCKEASEATPDGLIPGKWNVNPK